MRTLNGGVAGADPARDEAVRLAGWRLEDERAVDFFLAPDRLDVLRVAVTVPTTLPGGSDSSAEGGVSRCP
ncbi:MAG: hypothetical protein KDA94_15605 [Acidimicrobiales bacterium]|nr:hypothetical protein [Acidimicrobiales bacterium]